MTPPRVCSFAAGEYIIRKGESGEHFYILESGHAVALIPQPDGTEQPVKHYEPRELFGEKALLESAPRGASIRAEDEVTCFKLSRHDFEKHLGPLSQLKAEAYLADPRKMIADFYGPGSEAGPAGSLQLRLGKSLKDLDVKPDCTTKWFSVYRPCSRDSIAKMLGRIGVGKGLNIKGKSAKKNRLSGFVPFVQISDNSHKRLIEDSPPQARTHLYFRNETACQKALRPLQKTLETLIKETPNCMQVRHVVLTKVGVHAQTHGCTHGYCRSCL